MIAVPRRHPTRRRYWFGVAAPLPPLRMKPVLQTCYKFPGGQSIRRYLSDPLRRLNSSAGANRIVSSIVYQDMSGQSMAHALPVVLAADPAERLASLFDVHHDRLYRLARRLAPSTDDALDLVQETFLKAARCPRTIPTGRHERRGLAGPSADQHPPRPVAEEIGSGSPR